jgi:hypothetical protein
MLLKGNYGIQDAINALQGEFSFQIIPAKKDDMNFAEEMHSINVTLMNLRFSFKKDESGRLIAFYLYSGKNSKIGDEWLELGSARLA